MKKAIPVILIAIYSVCFTTVVQSQETDKNEFNTKKTEVNIAITNVFAKNNWFPYYVYDGNLVLPYYYYGFNQPRTKLLVGFKFHNPNGAVRLGTEFNYNTRKYNKEDDGSDNSHQKSFGSGLYAGYEWHSTFNRVNIYYGIDLSLLYSAFTYENTVNNDDHFSKINEIACGINPLVGVNFFITPNLSIGTEVKFTAEGFSGKTIYKYNGQEQDKEKTSGVRTQFGPLGFLSINIHF